MTGATVADDGVVTELVKRAQRADREAFRLIAAGIATRFPATAQDPPRTRSRRGRDHHPLVAVWRDLPDLRDTWTPGCQ
jgi:hypothetical protein